MMRRKRMLVSLGLGVAACWIAALVHPGDFSRRLRARHVGRTILVSADNRRLNTLYDGMVPDHRLDARAALEAAKARPNCQNSRDESLLGRLLSLFERVASAQGQCTATICEGTNTIQIANGFCNGTGCNGIFTQTGPDPNYRSSGLRQAE